MRRFANIFLVLFFCDGIVSLADELLLLITTSSPISGIRSILALLVVLAAIPIYVSLGIDKRLPKFIFLPQLLLIFWSIFDFWPLPLMLDRTSYMLPAAVGQVVLGIAPLVYLKKRSGRDWMLSADMFTQPFFGWRHTVVFFIVSLIIAPLVLVYMALSFASLQLYEHSGGFARLWPSGLQMTEKIYRSQGKEIRLTSMIHIADKTYFDEVLQSISSDRTIVLAEGVTDEDRRLSYRFSYGKLAQGLGLASQETMVFSGKMIGPEEIQSDAPAPVPDAAYHILRADIDVKDFHPKTVEFLNVIGRSLLSKNATADGLRRYLSWVRMNSPEFTPDTVMADILHKRNREVIHQMNRMLDHYDTIIIPWGALHMPEIEAAVQMRDFRLAETRRRTSIDFKRMLRTYWSHEEKNGQ
ncbi:MAG: hypothetical protein P8X96_17205 [Desulfobacteraceae bacterium]